MRITGDEGGVRALKLMYKEKKENMMAHLHAAKRRGVAYFRTVNTNRYLLFEIRYDAGDTFTVNKFQEGSLEPPN